MFVGRAGPGPALETTLTCVMETNLFPCIGPKFRRINRTIHLKSGSGPARTLGLSQRTLQHRGGIRMSEKEGAVLYGYFRSSASYRVRIALGLK